MKIVDANLIIYANDAASPFHERSRTWWDTQLSGTEQMGLPWMTVRAVLRILTHPRISPHPLSPKEAWELVDSWLKQPCVILIHPTTAHHALFRNLVTETQATGNLISDAALAALAIEYGAELYSADGDFARFPGLKWRNPL